MSAPSTTGALSEKELRERAAALHVPSEVMELHEIHQVLEGSPELQYRFLALMALLGAVSIDQERGAKAITRVRWLLDQVGTFATCRGENCGERLRWIKTRAGKNMPLNESDGEPHHASCPDVDRFRQPKSQS